MAESILYSQKEERDEKKEGAEEEEKMYIHLQELEVRERDMNMSKCESCVSVGRFESVAVLLCFLCEMYVCGKCLNIHKWHEGMKVEKNVLRGRVKKVVQDVKIEREKNERKRMIGKFVDELMNESEAERRKELKNSHRIVCDRVEVKHELDQTNCGMTGFCGLENRGWVVCDWLNYCIKISKLGSHVIQRYILFVGSRPWDVTEIDLKQNSTKPNFGSSDISATDRADPDKKCLIAVTLPFKRQIMFINLSKKPTKTGKIIKTEGECFSIQFHDDKVFTVCREGPDSPCSVCIYSTDGDTLNKFDTGLYGLPEPYLAVVSGRVYLTDGHNQKVQCRNLEGQLISEITFEGSVPRGITVDPDSNVYVCEWRDNKVYKLDADLTRYKSVLDQTTGYIERPLALCYYRDKLFISHLESPSLWNFVTVVRLL